MLIEDGAGRRPGRVRGGIDEAMTKRVPERRGPGPGGVPAGRQQQIDTLLGLITALLLLAIIIALFGIVNTLALSIFERTREIGLLRAVGMAGARCGA